ncbi:MAG: branched-chain amino acid ABC transporter permease [Xanthobacteraceae bacterium]
MFAQQFLNGLVSGMVYALFALGLSLVYGVHRVLNLAHGAVFMWGALVGLLVVVKFELPLWAALIVAMAFSGLTSVLLDYLAFRPLRLRHGDELATIVSSIGANLIMMNLAQQVTGAQILNFPLDIVPFENYRIAGLLISLQNIVIAVCALVLVGAMALYLFHTAFGSQVRAVAVNENMSQLIGINPQKIYFQTFFLSGALAGAAGVILGVAYNSVSYMMGEPMLLRAFAIIVLGGLGSVAGALIASLFFGVVEALTVSYGSSQLSDMVMFFVLFIVLLVRPSGLFQGLHHEHRKA